MLELGKLYRSKTTHYFFPLKEVLKASFDFLDDESEEIFSKHESEIGHLGTEDIFVLLKEDWLQEPGSIYQILLTDGRIGWITSSEFEFQEVKNQ